MIYPRGYRDKNPGNERPGQPWDGIAGIDHDPVEGDYLIFETPQFGIRAIVKTLLTYQTKYKLTTVAGIIARWAPRSDRNPTDAYIADVAAALGIASDAPFKLTAETALPFVHAIITQELGNPKPFGLAQWYADDIVSQGIALAF